MNVPENVPDEYELDISIVDILDYVGESVRPIKEGYAVFAANHIVCIGFRQASAQSVQIVAYVNQSSHPGQTPHHLELDIGKPISKWFLKCSCKAGTAKCKHIVACLMHIEKHKRIEYLSCTDVTQVWGKNKSDKALPWKAKRVVDLCCVQHPKLLSETEDEAAAETKEKILSESFDRILSVSKDSAIYKHREGRVLNPRLPYANRALQAESQSGNSNTICTTEDLVKLLTSTSNKIVIDCIGFGSGKDEQYFQKFIARDIQQSVKTALLTCDQNSNEWKMQRSTRITASSCYQLFTYLTNKNPDWNKKIDRYWSLRPLDVKSTRYGKKAEPLAFNAYRAMWNPLIRRCGLVIHPEESWIAGSPDGVDPTKGVLLEIKCPVGDKATLDDILNSPAVTKYVKSSQDGQKKLNINHAYYCQVQINMWILNCPTCDFVIYSQLEDDFIVIQVPFDPKFVEKVVNSLKKLYFEKMLSKLITKQ